MYLFFILVHIIFNDEFVSIITEYQEFKYFFFFNKNLIHMVFYNYCIS